MSAYGSEIIGRRTHKMLSDSMVFYLKVILDCSLSTIILLIYIKGWAYTFASYTMRTNDHKKNNHYGVLCGLRANALGDSDSDASRSSTPEPPPKDEIHVRPPITPVNQRRPQSLTLPFENRNRESHLVSEEEFDRIVRQAELDDGVPSLSTTRPRNVSTGGLRRSISTARNTAFLRQRPVSLDVGSLVPLSAQGRDKGRPDSLSRDSTLTALPRPPTINQMAGKPVQE